MLGILATVLMQSSSTVTSIIVGLVAAGVIPVKYVVLTINGIIFQNEYEIVHTSIYFPSF